MSRSNFIMGPPLSKSSREKFKEAVERRFPNDEDRVKFIDNAAGRFIDKGLGLLTYDALLVAICAIGIDPANHQILSVGRIVGIALSVVASLVIMLFTLRVLWVTDMEIVEHPQQDFEHYVNVVANRGIAVNLGLYLSMLSTIFVVLAIIFRF
jgi:hypothetical protein